MVGHAKRRAPQHLIDERGIALLKRVMPVNWVLREYRPDYGLDYAVEVFEDAGTPYPQTLGEHFFIQLKSTDSPKIGSLQLHRRGNVEKGREKLDDEPSMSIETYRLSLETSELVTIERMGVGLPVLLVIADLTRERCIFVCLNDYIDKILVPRFDDYRDKEHRTIHLPCTNDVSGTVGRIALRWYAKRSKLFSAFQRFTFQHSELNWAENGDWRSLAEHFAQKIARYDFWDDVEMCPIIGHYRDGLRRFIETGQPGLIERSIPLVDVRTFEGEMDDHLRKVDVFLLWQGLSILPKNYEDVWREWFLPTDLGQALSTPMEET
ncbi:DUF4365 domain-containing protein [Mesorhizobium sp. B2-1-3A]|uniref:DUF4365 domain-containing protein n=1 Tax=Mesorhizobium sp. B2-1-3A TaxID=2589971 RepID=UPI00112AF787|nr:DUF4365 domain-containing protein [Mesorhizobium sp. B2-1-3A]TPM97706.1 DUF4365 domain-containing protein [Mesorhizobium sp. B2-1-3A]